MEVTVVTSTYEQANHTSRNAGVIPWVVLRSLRPEQAGSVDHGPTRLPEVPGEVFRGDQVEGYRENIGIFFRCFSFGQRTVTRGEREHDARRQEKVCGADL